MEAVSAYAILQIAVGTFGLNQQLDCANNPALPGCEGAFTLPDPVGSPSGTGSTPAGSPSGTGG